MIKKPEGVRVYCPGLANRVGVVAAEGPQQSEIFFDDALPMARRIIMPNEWFVRGDPPARIRRVNIKRVRVRI